MGSVVSITEVLPKFGNVMGRAIKQVDLSKREGRSKLAVRTEPYWSFEREGAHIGYYRGARVGKWVARYKLPGTGGGYSKATLGEADDAPNSIVSDRVLDWKAAKAKATEWFSLMDRTEGVRSGPYTVADALDDYIARFRGKDLINTRRRIEAFIRTKLGHYDTAKLTSKQIKRWHEDLADAPARLRTAKGAEQNVRLTADSDEGRRSRQASANRVLTILKAALNRAYQDGDTPSDHAWRKVKRFENADGVNIRYLSDEEARRLVNAVAPSFRAMVQAALLTGARYAELGKLEARDFDRQSRTVRLRRTKAGDHRDVYLGDEGFLLFDAATAGKAPNQPLFPRPDGGKWGASQQARPLAAACKAAGIEKTGFHDLRRTFGARLALQGVPMVVIAKALGHKDERITQRHYAHLAETYVAKTIRTASAGLGVVSGGGNIIKLATMD
jgi:integrase